MFSRVVAAGLGLPVEDAFRQHLLLQSAHLVDEPDRLPVGLGGGIQQQGLEKGLASPATEAACPGRPGLRGDGLSYRAGNAWVVRNHLDLVTCFRII